MYNDQTALNENEIRNLESKLFDEFGVTGIVVDFVRNNKDNYFIAFASYEDANDKLNYCTITFNCHPEGDKIVDFEIIDYTNIRKV